MALYQDALRTASGTPEDCIRFLDLYEALGIEEVILLSPSGRRSTRRCSTLSGSSANT
jgi:hypothetical protein